jgi:hypothetical protein
MTIIDPYYFEPLVSVRGSARNDDVLRPGQLLHGLMGKPSIRRAAAKKVLELIASAPAG